jgi:hypothetical protein
MEVNNGNIHVFYSPQNGPAETNYAHNLAAVLLSAEGLIVRSFGIKDVPEMSISVFVCGQDLEPFMLHNIGVTARSFPRSRCMIVPNESGNGIFFGYVTPCLHELMHLILDNMKAYNKDSIGWDSSQANRIHLVIYEWSKYIEHTTYPNMDYEDEWLLIKPHIISESSLKDQLTIVSELIWSTEDALGITKKIAVNGDIRLIKSMDLYDSLFMYASYKYGPDIYARLIKGAGSTAYPWNVFQCSETSFAEDYIKWANGAPLSVSEYMDIFEHGTNDASVYYGFVGNRGSARTGVFLAVWYINELDCDKSTLDGIQPEGIRREVRNMWVIRANDIVNDALVMYNEKQIDKALLYLLKEEPQNVDYTPDSQWGRCAIKISNLMLMARVAKYGGCNDLYLNMLDTYCMQHPMNLEMLIRKYNMSSDVRERRDVANRILNHPGVQLSEEVFKGVINQCPDIVKYVNRRYAQKNIEVGSDEMYR